MVAWAFFCCSRRVATLASCLPFPRLWLGLPLEVCALPQSLHFLRVLKLEVPQLHSQL